MPCGTVAPSNVRTKAIHVNDAVPPSRRFDTDISAFLTSVLGESPKIHPWQAIHIYDLYTYMYDLYDLYDLYALCLEYAKLIQVAVLEDLDHTSITLPNWAEKKFK